MPDLPEPTQIMGDGGWVPLSVERMQEVLPQYEVIEMLGRGGMGAVYKARQRSLNRLVAIKILPLGLANDEFQFAERFRNEAQTMAQMNHPAIVNVYDFGETPEGLLYFVMEFVDGTDVHQMIKASGKLSAEHALAIAAHVCDALTSAHQRGIIHRDIKPANILINQEGQVKVADFGLAKMHDPAQTSGLTRTNMAMGTPDYAAPEVFAPGGTADHRADLYAVGVMLYQMLTGEVPRGMFKLPSQKGLGSDPRFDAIIIKAMEVNRDERFQSAMEVRHALDEILTTPLPKDAGTGAISARALPRSQVAPKPQPAQTPPSSGKVKWLAPAAIVAVFGVAGFFVWNGKKKPAVTTSIAATPPPLTAETRKGYAPAAATLSTSDPRSVATIDWLKLARWREPWSLEDGRLKSTGKDVSRYLGVAGDAAVRVRFREAAAIASKSPPLQISFRGGPDGSVDGQINSYLFQVHPTRKNIQLLSMAKNTHTNVEVPEFLWRDLPLPPPTQEGGEMDLELRATGQELSLWAGATQVASIRDARAQSGAWVLTGSPGVEITALETSGITPNEGTISLPEAGNAPPKITNWQDVTATFREKVRAIPGAVVEDGAVYLAKGSASQRFILTPPGVNRFALRVRFTGGTQVDRMKEGSGFDFVICQKSQVGFKRVTNGNVSEDLCPWVPHPAGYENNVPHNLLVTMNGTSIRAWVDGRFIGEARDEVITEGEGGLMLLSYTTIHKVEIAELAK